MDRPDRLDDSQFYAELDDAHRLALPTCRFAGTVYRSRTTTAGGVEALVAVMPHPEGGLTWSAVAPVHLVARCREVSRAATDALHPALVRRLARDLATQTP